MIFTLKKNKILFVLISFFTIVSASSKVFAVPADPTPTVVTQPNGTTITLEQKGDEFLNYTINADNGYLVEKDEVSGYWKYLSNASSFSSETSFISTNVNAEESAPANAISAEEYASKMQWLAEKNMKLLNEEALISSRSTVIYNNDRDQPEKLLVIVVAFNDVAAITSNDHWKDKIFGVGTNSVNDFYKENSNGKFYFEPAVRPPNPNGIMRVSYNANHPNPPTTSSTLTKDIFKKAIDEAKTAGFDFDYYDTNANNRLEPNELHILVIAEGYEGSSATAPTPSVWGHRSTYMYTIPSTALRTSSYTMIGSTMKHSGVDMPISIGVMCHELGHDLLAPDLYNTVTSTDIDTPHGLSLMDSGSWGNLIGGIPGSMPTHFDPWSKMWLNFKQPDMVVSSNTGSIALNPPSDPTNYNMVKIPIKGTTEQYFIAEYRKPSGFDSGFGRYYTSLGQTEGVVFWRIDEGHIEKLKKRTPNNTTRKADTIIPKISRAQPFFKDTDVFNSPNSDYFINTSDYTDATKGPSAVSVTVGTNGSLPTLQFGSANSSTETLTSLSIINGRVATEGYLDLSPAFNPNTFNYVAKASSGNLEDIKDFITIKATASPGVSITGTGVFETKDGRNAFHVVLTDSSGKESTYIIELENNSPIWLRYVNIRTDWIGLGTTRYKTRPIKNVTGTTIFPDSDSWYIPVNAASTDGGFYLEALTEYFSNSTGSEPQTMYSVTAGSVVNTTAWSISHPAYPTNSTPGYRSYFNGTGAIPIESMPGTYTAPVLNTVNSSSSSFEGTSGIPSIHAKGYILNIIDDKSGKLLAAPAIISTNNFSVPVTETINSDMRIIALVYDPAINFVLESNIVTIAKSSDASVTSIKYDGTTMTLNAGIYEHTLPVGTVVDISKIVATPTASTSTVSPVTPSITPGHTHEVTVTAEDGTTILYKINIKVALSNDASVTNIKYDGNAMGLNAGIYEHTLPSGSVVDISKIVATPTASTATVSPVVASITPGHTHEVTVTAEDTTTTVTYKINIKIAPLVASTDSSITGISYNAIPMNLVSGVYTYTLPVGNTVDLTKVLVSAAHANATVSAVTPSITPGHTHEVMVTAEDGVSKTTYKLNLIISAPVLSNDASVTSIKYDGNAMGLNAGIYEYTLPFASVVDISKIIATPTASTATVSAVVASITPGHTHEVTVTAEDTTTTVTYKINIKIAPLVASTDSSITGISYNAIPMNLVSGVYTYTLPTGNTVDLTKVLVSAAHANATVSAVTPSITPGHTHEVMVTAEDGVSKTTYKLNLIISAPVLSNDASVTSIKYDGNAMGLNAGIYEYTLPFASVVDISKIIATPTASTATVSAVTPSITPGHTHEVMVTAENGVTTITYKINMKIAPLVASTDSSITGISYNAIPMNLVSGIYTYTLPVGNTVDLTKVLVSATHANATVSAVTPSITPGHTHEVMVTAEDGVSKTTYKLNLIISAPVLSNDASVTSIKYDGNAMGLNAGIYEYTLPFASVVDISKIIATPTASTATVSAVVASITPGHTHEVTVTAEDTTTTVTYKINIKIAPLVASTDSSITGISYNAIPMNLVSGVYTYTLPTGNTVDLTKVLVSAAHANATVSAVTPSITPGHTHEVMVTAEDGVSKTTYKLNLIISAPVLSNDASVTSIKYDGNAMGLNAGIYEYTLPFASVVDISKIIATPTASTATVSAVTPSITPGHTHEVMVTAENGVTTITYKINMKIAPLVASTDSSITGISYNAIPMNLVSGIYTYTLPVGNTVDLTKVLVSATHANATVSAVTPSSTPGHTHEVMVTAEDGVSKTTYKLNLIISAPVLSNDASVTSIKYDNIPMGLMGDIYNINLTTGSAIDVSKIAVSLSHPAATSTTITPVVAPTHTHEFTVTAQDGVTKITYKINITTGTPLPNNTAVIWVKYDNILLPFNGTAYSHTLPIGAAVDINKLTMLLADTSATVTAVTPSIGSGWNYEFTVTAVDGVTKTTYRVNLITQNVVLSNDANISTVSYFGQNVSLVEGIYKLVLPFNTVPDVTGVVVTPSHPNATVSVVPTGLANLYMITVTAEDGTTKNMKQLYFEIQKDTTIISPGGSSSSSGSSGRGSSSSPNNVPVAREKNIVIELFAGKDLIFRRTTENIDVKNNILEFKIDNESDNYRFKFPLDNSTKVNAGKNGLYRISFPGGTFDIPFKMLEEIDGLKEFISSSNLKTSDLVLQLSVTKLSGSNLKNAEESYSKLYPNGKILSKFYEVNFELLDVENNKLNFNANNFKNRMILSLSCNTGANAVLNYNATSKTFSPAPAVIKSGYVDLKTYSTGGIYVVVSNDIKFTDTNNHWSKKAVEHSANKTFVKGMGDNTYAPDKEMTRAEFIQLIVASMQIIEKDSDKKYNDETNKNAWYYDSLTKANAAGLLKTFEGASLSPDKAITREEAVSVIASVLAYENIAGAATADLSSFKDLDSLDSSKMADLSLVYGFRIMQGTGDGYFEPNSSITRAQAAVIIQNTMRTLGLSE